MLWKSITDSRTDLDDFAFGFAKAVNTIHSNEGDGKIFFHWLIVDSSDNAASTIRVTQEIRDNPDNIVSGASLTNEISWKTEVVHNRLQRLQHKTLATESRNWDIR
ncbi:MAG: hypothetical protein U5K84_10930 [Alkalibacterium sp.]|nr:hypothetical protein [Alkalibacterium sp.]